LRVLSIHYISAFACTHPHCMSDGRSRHGTLVMFDMPGTSSCAQAICRCFWKKELRSCTLSWRPEEGKEEEMKDTFLLCLLSRAVCSSLFARSAVESYLVDGRV